jgi:hypothetical protein
MIYSLLVLLAIITRLLPHAANVAPIGALALFAGATALDQPGKFGKIAAYLLPFAALIISDTIIGFYTWQVMVTVYLGFLISLGLGLLIRRSYRWQTIIGASLAGSVIFFLLTNAAVWAFTNLYSHNLTGLIESYIAALPFFRNSLIGDLLYTGAIFGAYAYAQQVKQVHLSHQTL